MLQELPIDVAERGAVGYTPMGLESSNLGKNSADTIAGGDVRIFSVKVQEAAVEEIPHAVPPTRPHGRWLALRGAIPIKQEILSRPTFFEHFDGVCVDWRYLHEREKGTLEHETGWLKRQGVRIVVDLSSGVDLYPMLRLIDNLHADYQASLATIDGVLAKMQILGARDLILSLQRYPENNFSDQQTKDSFTATLKTLASQTAARGVTLQLRIGFGKPPKNVPEALELVDRVGAPNLKMAPSTTLLEPQTPTAEMTARLRDKLGLWLVAASRRDLSGKLWDASAPIHSSVDRDTLVRWLSVSPGAPLVLDALLADQDAEYLEVLALERAERDTGR